MQQGLGQKPRYVDRDCTLKFTLIIIIDNIIEVIQRMADYLAVEKGDKKRPQKKDKRLILCIHTTVMSLDQGKD